MNKGKSITLGVGLTICLIALSSLFVNCDGQDSSTTNINFYFADMLRGVSTSPVNNPNLCLQNCTREELLRSKVEYVYNSTVYPLNLAILSGQDTRLEGVFAQDIVGRISPLGTFEGYNELLEYFYGLAGTPEVYILKVDYVDLFASADNEVYVRVNFLVQQNDIGGNVTIPLRQFNLTQFGRFLFNEDDLIISMDLNIRNPGPILDPPNEAARQQQIQNNCGVLLISPGNCNSTNDPTGYYTDFADCVSFMQSIDFGSWNNAASNSVICRTLHTILTIYDPTTHCKHAGKTGGGKCIDFTYESYYDKNY